MLTLLFLACRTSPTPTPAVTTDPVWDHAERIVLGDGSACTIIAMHGRGDSPTRFRRLYEPLDLNAVVYVPRAPVPLRPEAWSWFASTRDVDRDELTRQVTAAADRLAAALDGLPGEHPSAPPIVTGFSQGGMLSFALATRHPQAITAALPLGGALYGSPTAPSRAPIRAFHGDIDHVVPLAPTKQAVDQLAADGWDATLQVYPQTAHTVSTAMRADYARALATYCR